MNTDLIVIGGGPGGYVAAIRGAQLGLNVVIVEKNELGGTCLNTGCIPTKALFKDAQVLNYFNHAEEYGIKVDKYGLDLEKVQKRKKKIIKTLTGGVKGLLKANKVIIEKGEAKLISKDSVEIKLCDGSKKTIKGKNILIASGSKSSKPPIKGADLGGVITSKEALEMTTLPKKIVIVGGGVIGIEFAGILNEFGSDVIIVEFLDSIIPMVDKEVASRLTKLLSKRGIKIIVSSKVEEIYKTDEELIVEISKNGEITKLDCTNVLISTGRELDIEGLNLEGLGIRYDKKGIEVDENYCTSMPGVYAIGDVIGGVMLAHVASEEGKVAVERMVGEKTSVDYNLVPNSIFTFPEVSTVGLSEEEVKDKNLDYIVSKFQFSGNGKALTMNDSEGMVKIIASKDKTTIYGVHIIGPNASDLIHEAVVAMKAMLTVEEVASIMHGHPTLSEAFLEASMGILDKAIHLPPIRK
ncbi:TPA: dihydrolipoyl dehydrogenase [Clostridioides difficile]|uniref:dihydrolipoyl dehydrogenase n=1 Tax=Clostridioides difficile TaxID=1496 RepID=UPI0009801317|nr:dihydrolipoyl dehydrogenase [Clostridioides difficile]EGT4598789.1 dihydrolipoyl dehydrogenase [Clostridioides difficile]MDK3179158.1 dihydrolipoyl dehydrogenase [Clostridioides difficile]MDW0091730.1 dihydrolipoyl dehydrogenase [Clostridioides difficile]SJT01604.1 Dihydrolipoyl dehydrogenase [Clostridioides difficile]SJT04048.1 Dihydrolipoyl dehydrogenase [Clostridioides difficile]